MFSEVKKYIQKNEILQKGDSVIIGVSGGADSVCLLWVLKELQAEYRLRLLTVHIHHGIRGKEAWEDADFTKKLCEKWEIPFCMKQFDVPALARERGISLEEAGRKIRYETFENIRLEQGADKIAVAHHKDDNAETILWNMLRGSGLRGLAGMEAVRGFVIRPLLCVDREQIEKWLIGQNISWRTDFTNLETDFTRNKLRLQLMPWIEKNLTAGLKDRLVQQARIFSEEDRYFKEQAGVFLEKEGRQEAGRIYFSVRKIKEESPAVVRYVLRIALERLIGSLKDVTANHIQAILELDGVGKKINLPHGILAWMDYQNLYLGKPDRFKPQNQKCRMETEVFFYEKGQKIPESIYTKWFDYDKIKNTVQLRTRESGDWIQILPGAGRKKLKDYMIDAKIPRELRDQIPVIADGADILWVVGYRMSEAYKITEETTAVLQISIKYS